MGKPLRTKILLLSLGLALGAAAQTIDLIPFRAVLPSTPPQTPPGSVPNVATIIFRIVRDASGVITQGTINTRIGYQLPRRETFTGLKFYRSPTDSPESLLLDTHLAPQSYEAGGSLIAQEASLPPAMLGRSLDRLLAAPRSLFLVLETAQRAPERAVLESADEVIRLSRLEGPGVAALGAISVLATRDPRGRLTSAQVKLNATFSGYDAPALLSTVRLSLRANPAAQILAGAPTNFAVPVESTGSYTSTIEVAATPANTDLVTALLANPAAVDIAIETVLPARTLRGVLSGTDRITFFPNPQKPLRLRFHTLRDGTGQAIAAVATVDVASDTRALSVRGVDQSLVLQIPSLAPNAFINLMEPNVLAGLNSILSAPDQAQVAVAGGAPTPLSRTLPPPVAQSVTSAVWDPRHRPISPGGLFTVFGQNLAKVPGDLAGLTGNRIPTSLNGTAVLMAGRAVPIIDVQPDHVIAQVPTDMPPGPQPVIVRTSSGESGTVIAAVTPTAPAVFFRANTPEGNVAAVYKANGTEVSMDNPARPGDTLLFFSSGFGARTQPALATGLAAPSEPLVRTPNPTVTIGGRPAPVLYSVLAPGLVGIVQTAVRMPQSAGAGNIPLTVSLGPDRSNPTIIYAAIR